MKKRFIAAIILALFVLLGTTLTVFGGPVEKATGSIEILNHGTYRTIEFNAHEATLDKPVKGKWHWVNFAADGTIIDEAYIDILDFYVEGNTALFKGICSFHMLGSLEGKYYYFKVVDDGTPALNGDAYMSKWSNYDLLISDSSWIVKNITDGNLVVHNNN